MSATRAPWKYEPETKTIRAHPENYWLATMDSWDGMPDHAANAKLIASAPELLAMLKKTTDELGRIAYHGTPPNLLIIGEAQTMLARLDDEVEP